MRRARCQCPCVGCLSGEMKFGWGGLVDMIWNMFFKSIAWHPSGGQGQVHQDAHPQRFGLHCHRAVSSPHRSTSMFLSHP